MTRMGTAFDRCCNQAVDAEASPQHVQEIELFLGKLTIGGRDIAGQRIRGLAQFRRQRLGDDVAGLIEPVLLAQQIGTVPADFGQTFVLEVAKDRQIAHQPADGIDFRVGHDPFGRRHQNHGVDQCAVVVDRLRHLLDILREIVMFPVGGRHPAGGRTLEESDAKGTFDMMKIVPELARALATGTPAVALESTLICHGIPKPENAALAIDMERCVRAEGALPATMAVIDGSARIGLEQDELLALAAADDVAKCTTRDLPMVMASGGKGATTVASTIYLAARHDIQVMATGGLGGVHLGGERSLDVSADLFELQRSPVAVVCAGIKSILDQTRTMEVLESLGVPVIGYRCRELPAFYTAESGIDIPSVDDLDQLAAVVRSHRALGLPSGLVIATPPPSDHALSGDETAALVDAANEAAERAAIIGAAQTPFMLRHMAEASAGRTVTLNVHLAKANATLAARLAAKLADHP